MIIWMSHNIYEKHKHLGKMMWPDLNRISRISGIKVWEKNRSNINKKLFNSGNYQNQKICSQRKFMIVEDLILE